MMLYAGAFALSLLLSTRLSRAQDTPGGVRRYAFERTGKALLAMLPLMLLALFRWNVGADSVYGRSYSQAYHAAAAGVNPRGFEIGFGWLMRLFAQLETPYFYFLFAHGVLFFALVAYAVYRGSVWGTWSVALFFLLTVYFDAYSSLRQALAEAICLIGWAKMGQDANGIKKDVSILLIFLISTLFHTTGWLNIPIYLLSRLRFRGRGDVLLLAALALAATPLLQKVIPIIMNAFSSNDRYMAIGLSRINIGVTGLFFALVWLFYDEIDRSSANGYMYVNQALIIFVLIVNSGAMYLPYRVYDMLKIGYVLIIPAMLASITDEKSRFLAQVIVGGVCAATFLNFLLQPGSPYIHYQSALSNWRQITGLP